MLFEIFAYEHQLHLHSNIVSLFRSGYVEMSIITPSMSDRLSFSVKEENAILHYDFNVKIRDNSYRMKVSADKEHNSIISNLYFKEIEKVSLHFQSLTRSLADIDVKLSYESGNSLIFGWNMESKIKKWIQVQCTKDFNELLNINGKIILKDNENWNLFAIQINAPLINSGVTLDLNINFNDFLMKSALKWGHGKEVHVQVSYFMNYTKAVADFSFQSTDLGTFIFSTNTSIDGGIKSNTKVQVGESELELGIILSYNSTITLKIPFKGYSFIQINVNFDLKDDTLMITTDAAKEDYFLNMIINCTATRYHADGYLKLAASGWGEASASGALDYEETVEFRMFLTRDSDEWSLHLRTSPFTNGSADLNLETSSLIQGYKSQTSLSGKYEKENLETSRFLLRRNDAEDIIDLKVHYAHDDDQMYIIILDSKSDVVWLNFGYVMSEIERSVRFSWKPHQDTSSISLIIKSDEKFLIDAYLKLNSTMANIFALANINRSTLDGKFRINEHTSNYEVRRWKDNITINLVIDSVLISKYPLHGRFELSRNALNLHAYMTGFEDKALDQIWEGEDELSLRVAVNLPGMHVGLRGLSNNEMEVGSIIGIWKETMVANKLDIKLSTIVNDMLLTVSTPWTHTLSMKGQILEKDGVVANYHINYHEFETSSEMSLSQALGNIHAELRVGRNWVMLLQGKYTEEEFMANLHTPWEDAKECIFRYTHRESNTSLERELDVTSCIFPRLYSRLSVQRNSMGSNVDLSVSYHHKNISAEVYYEEDFMVLMGNMESPWLDATLELRATDTWVAAFYVTKLSDSSMGFEARLNSTNFYSSLQFPILKTKVYVPLHNEDNSTRSVYFDYSYLETRGKYNITLQNKPYIIFVVDTSHNTSVDSSYVQLEASLKERLMMVNTGWKIFQFEKSIRGYINVSDNAIETKFKVLQPGIEPWTFTMEAGGSEQILFLQIGTDFRFVILPGVCEIHILDQTHALKYDIDSESSDRFTGKLELTSPLIAPSELRVEFKRNAGNMSKADIAFFCGERNYTITFACGLQPRVELDMNVLMDTEKLLQVSSVYDLQKYKLDFVLRFRDMESRVEIKHRSIFSANSYFRIKSPFLLRNTPVYGHMHINSETLTIEVGRGEEEGRRFIRLDGNLRLDKGVISVHFKSPFYSHLRSFGLEGHMNTGKNPFFSTTANIILSDSSTYTASIGSHFTKDESLDALALINFNLPNHKEEYGANIHIPLRFGYSATFNTTLSIPDLYYSLEASYSFAQDEFNIFAQARGKETLLRMLIQAEKQPSFYLTAEFDSPFSGFEHYLLRLGEKSDATVHFIEWGERRIELRHHFILEKDAFLCTVELNTPFQNHERYGMHVDYQNKARKIGIARIRYPGLKKDLGVELDFLVNGIFDVKVEAKFHAPLSEKFQSGTVSLTHRASSNHYEVRILGEYNSRVLGAEVKVTGSISQFVLELKGRRDDSVSVLRVDTTSPETKRQRVRLEITSPLPALRHLEVDIDASYAAVYVAVIHNNVTYVDLKIDSNGKIVFINPLKSLLLEIGKKLKSGKQLSVELGWESNGELKPRLGVGLIYTESRYREEDTLFIRIPSQENPYVLKMVKGDTENGVERAFHVFWGTSTLGFSVLVHRSPTNTTGLLRLDLPARSFEASASIVHGDKNLTHDFEFLWDAARNRSAAIGYRVRRLDEHSVSLTVRHPLLGEEGASVRARLKLLASRRLVDVDAHLGLDYHSKQQFFASAALYASTMERLSAGFSLDHPASLLSVVTLAEISRESTKVRAKYSVVYRTPSVRGEREVFGLAQTSLEPPSLLLKARTNEAALRVRARIANCSADASLALDDRKPVRLRVRLLAAERAVAAALDLAGGELRYRARAALPHWRRASVEVWRQGRGGAHTRELGAAVSLSGSRQLWAAARWRPRAVHELRPALQAELEQLPDVATLLADGHARLARERWTLRVPAPDVRPLAKYGRQQMEHINADIRQMFDSARRVYESNKEIIQEFANDSQSWLNKNVLRSLLHVVLEALLETCRVLERFVKLCNEALSLDQFVQTSFDCLVRIQKRLKELMASAQTHLVEITKTFAIVASALLDEFKEYLNEQVTRPVVAAFWNCNLAMASAAKIIVTRYLEFFAHFENLFQLNEISEIAAYYSDVINWLESGNFTREVKSYTDQVIQLLLNDLEITLDHLRSQIEQSAPPLLPVLTHIYHKLEWAWNHYNIGAKILSYLINVLDDAKEELQTDYFKFDPEKGYLRYSQKLPVDWESFDQLPRFEQLTSVTSPSGSASLEDRLDLFNDVSYTESVINKTLASILPSFTQTGLLVGMKHIVTFDGLSYELKGMCSYLLSADFLHYSYAIIVHYDLDVEDKFRRSFTILTQDHRVDISSDYSVRVDERYVELPAHLSDALRVARTEDSVELQAAPGVSFRCHVRHHVCSVRLSGWLFGRTAGLLGSFDRDRADDVEWSHAEEPEEAWRLGFCADRLYRRFRTTPSTPYSSWTSNSSRTPYSSWTSNSSRTPYSSWTSNSSRTPYSSWTSNSSWSPYSPWTPSPTSTPSTPLPHVGGDCARMFRAKRSPLRACARLVDPTPFERLCARAGACEAAMAYREMCRQQAKITVRAPAFCESCRLPGGRELPSEETAVLPAWAVRRVEVVYVVEKGCSQPFNTSDAVDELEKALDKKMSWPDVQYAVVGYGGVDAPEPQLHTAPGGLIWFGEHVLKKTLMRLKWSGGRSAADPAAAVAAAVGLRQRAMSGRLLVLLQCSAAPSEQQSSPLRRLPAGMQLHVLRPGPVVHEAPPHTVGLDGKHLMVGPANETSFAVRPFPDNTLQNMKENDMCGWAAIESGGTVFDSSLTAGALDAWAGRVASDVYIPQCRRVSCGPGAVVLCNEHNATPQTSEEADVEFESFLGLPKRGKEINNSSFVDL